MNEKNVLYRVAVTAAAALAVGATTAQAQSTVAASDATESAGLLSEVVVTGTRQTGIEAAQSAAPIQVVSVADLQAALGKGDLMSALAQIIPSLTMQAYGFDMSSNTVQAKLKGLSPNHVLVLVNGKRRHGTADLASDAGSVYQGGASTDLNFIPVSAIDHIEVLTEGAAAQYGSDAIAGVINIILKKNTSGIIATGTYGAYYDGGPAGNTVPWSFNGTTNTTTLNGGFEPMDGAYLNISGEIHNHGHSDRSPPDAREDNPANLATYPNDNVVNYPGYPSVTWLEGDAETHSKLASYNAGWDLGGGTEIYSFGTYGTKTAEAFENYRAGNVLAYTDPVTAITTYPRPEGYEPTEAIEEIDYASTAGVRGVASGWHWDLSMTWGRDHIEEYTDNSGNPGIYNTTGLLTPVNYYDGSMVATQWTNNADFNRDFDVGLAGPLNVAFGFEARKDWYVITAGQPESYLGGGPSSFAGFTPTNAGDNSRFNLAGYVDLATKPIDRLLIDLAGRYEHYSDFGSATVGKLTSRYDFSPAFAVRGTVSNGFRAPTLAEEYYSITNLGPSSTDMQLAPDGVGAKVLGLGLLQPEKSVNLGLGFVARPIPDMSVTLDIYQIRITNRVVGSNTLNGLLNGQLISPLINQVVQATGVQINPVDINTGIYLFTNGVNTTTDGADLAFQYPVNYGAFGKVNYTIGSTVNATKVTYVKPLPHALVAALAGTPLYGPQTISDLSEANPKFVINLGADWALGKFTLSILDRIYGPSSEEEPDNGDNASGNIIYYRTTIGTTSITNLDMKYQLTKMIAVSVGAINLFNKFPGLENANLVKAFNSNYAYLYNDPSAAEDIPIFSPFGINGGYYYVRGELRF